MTEKFSSSSSSSSKISRLELEEFEAVTSRSDQLVFLPSSLESSVFSGFEGLLELLELPAMLPDRRGLVQEPKKLFKIVVLPELDSDLIISGRQDSASRAPSNQSSRPAPSMDSIAWLLPLLSARSSSSSVVTDSA